MPKAKHAIKQAIPDNKSIIRRILPKKNQCDVRQLDQITHMIIVTRFSTSLIRIDHTGKQTMSGHTQMKQH